jgi:hypothetical protein
MLRQRLDVLGVGGGGCRADDTGITQPVPAGYVIRDRGSGRPATTTRISAEAHAVAAQRCYVRLARW